jgi:uncharacterized membrane protein YecN with MAPEG domain
MSILSIVVASVGGLVLLAGRVIHTSGVLNDPSGPLPQFGDLLWAAGFFVLMIGIALSFA